MRTTMEDALRERGMSSADIVMVKELAAHAQREVTSTLFRVAETAPDKLRLSIMIMAAAGLSISLRDWVKLAGPIGMGLNIRDFGEEK